MLFTAICHFSENLRKHVFLLFQSQNLGEINDFFGKMALLKGVIIVKSCNFHAYMITYYSWKGKKVNFIDYLFPEINYAEFSKRSIIDRIKQKPPKFRP